MQKERISLSYMFAFQKERLEKNDDLVPRLFLFLFQEEKRKRLSVALSVERREDVQQDFFLSLFFFSLFCFMLKKRRRPSSLQWREEGEFFLFYFHKERWQEMAYGADSFSLFLRSPFA